VPCHKAKSTCANGYTTASRDFLDLKGRVGKARPEYSRDEQLYLVMGAREQGPALDPLPLPLKKINAPQKNLFLSSRVLRDKKKRKERLSDIK